MANDEKRLIRNQYLALRKELSKESIDSVSHQIYLNLLTVDQFLNAETIHCYLTASQKHEIDTSQIIKWMKDHKKRIAIPRTEEKRSGMTHILFSSDLEFQLNRWGIREPVGGTVIDVKHIDTVLVPMVAADREMNRLGYGKGFYDRFLSECDVCKIGLVGDRFIHERALPVDERDVRMDVIVTDKEILF